MYTDQLPPTQAAFNSLKSYLPFLLFAEYVQHQLSFKCYCRIPSSLCSSTQHIPARKPSPLLLFTQSHPTSSSSDLLAPSSPST